MSAATDKPKAPTAKAPGAKTVAELTEEIDWKALLTLPKTVGWRDHVIGGAIAVIYVEF